MTRTDDIRPDGGNWNQIEPCLDELGLNYDSSVSRNSLYNKTDQKIDEIETIPYTHKRGTLTPGCDSDLIEIPWSYFNLNIGKVPFAGGPMVRLFGRRIIQAGIEQNLRRGNSVFYFHAIDIVSTSFPSVGNTRCQLAYWLCKGERTVDRIRTLLSATPSSRLITCSSMHKGTLAT
jgi:hypothetical protein